MSYSISLYDKQNSTFHLRDSVGATSSLKYGNATKAQDDDYRALLGDWNGDGSPSVGLYDTLTSTFHLHGQAGSLRWGNATKAANGDYQAIVGDWNGDDSFTVGLYDTVTSTFHLHGQAGSLRYGNATKAANGDYQAIAGDWNGDGTFTVGLYDTVTSTFYLYGESGSIRFGNAAKAANGDYQAIAGDWNGDGTFTVGLYDTVTSTFYLYGEAGGIKWGNAAKAAAGDYQAMGFSPTTEVVPTYTLEDALETELPAKYNIDKDTPFDAGAVTVANAKDTYADVEDILDNAENSSELVLEDLFSWSITDTATPILTDKTNVAILDADAVVVQGLVTAAQAAQLDDIQDVKYTTVEGVTLDRFTNGNTFITTAVVDGEGDVNWNGGQVKVEAFGKLTGDGITNSIALDNTKFQLIGTTVVIKKEVPGIDADTIIGTLDRGYIDNDEDNAYSDGDTTYATVTLNANATNLAVQTLLNGFQLTAITEGGGADVNAKITVQDGAANSFVADKLYDWVGPAVIANLDGDYREIQVSEATNVVLDVDTDATFTLNGAVLDGGTLTIDGGLSGDKIRLKATDSTLVNGEARLIGTTVSVKTGGNEILIGTVAAVPAAGQPMVITFNENATEARVQILLQNISVDLDTGTLGTRAFDFTLQTAQGEQGLVITDTVEAEASVNLVGDFTTLTFAQLNAATPAAPVTISGNRLLNADDWTTALDITQKIADGAIIVQGTHLIRIYNAAGKTADLTDITGLNDLGTIRLNAADAAPVAGTLTMTATQVSGALGSIAAGGTLNVEEIEDKPDVDLSKIVNAGTFDADVTPPVAGTTFTGNLGEADLTVTGDNTLTISASKATGKTIDSNSANDNIVINQIGTDEYDFSTIANGGAGDFVVSVEGAVVLHENTDLGGAQVKLAASASLTASADQLDGLDVVDAAAQNATLVITDLAGDGAAINPDADLSGVVLTGTGSTATAHWDNTGDDFDGDEAFTGVLSDDITVNVASGALFTTTAAKIVQAKGVEGAGNVLVTALNATLAADLSDVAVDGDMVAQFAGNGTFTGDIGDFTVEVYGAAGEQTMTLTAAKANGKTIQGQDSSNTYTFALTWAADDTAQVVLTDKDDVETTVTYTAIAGDDDLEVLAAHFAAKINADASDLVTATAVGSVVIIKANEEGSLKTVANTGTVTAGDGTGTAAPVGAGLVVITTLDGAAAYDLSNLEAAERLGTLSYDQGPTLTAAVNTATLHADTDLGDVAVTVNDDQTLTLNAAQADGKVIGSSGAGTDNGSVLIKNFGTSAYDFSDIASENGTVTVEVRTTTTVNAATDMGGVTHIDFGTPTTALTLTMTADQADGIQYRNASTFAKVNITATETEDDVTLYGTANADVLRGSYGEDTIFASRGADAIYLTREADDEDSVNTVIYTAANQSGLTSDVRDTLYDFYGAGVTGGDLIDLSALQAVAKNNNFGFLGTASFTAAKDGEVRYAQSGGNTTIEVDIDGDGVADMQIRVNGTHSFVAQDFVFTGALLTTTAADFDTTDGTNIDGGAKASDNNNTIDIANGAHLAASTIIDGLGGTNTVLVSHASAHDLTGVATFQNIQNLKVLDTFNNTLTLNKAIVDSLDSIEFTGDGTAKLVVGDAVAAATFDNTKFLDDASLTLANAANVITTVDDFVAAGKTLTVDASAGGSLDFDGSAETDGKFDIAGSDGEDTIVGGDGNDIINGGAGADTLTGGGGNDIFTYTAAVQSAGANVDTITDFNDEGADKVAFDVGASGITQFALDGSSYNLIGTASSALAIQQIAVASVGSLASSNVALNAFFGGLAGFADKTAFITALTAANSSSIASGVSYQAFALNTAGTLLWIANAVGGTASSLASAAVFMTIKIENAGIGAAGDIILF